MTWWWGTLQTFTTMFCPWNLCLVLSISLPLSCDVLAHAGEGDEETQRGGPKSGPETVHFRGSPLRWSLSSSEQLDRQGVIGEYDGSQESTETTVSNLDGQALDPSRPTGGSTEGAADDGGLATTLEQRVLSYEPADFGPASFLPSARTSEDDSASAAPHFETDRRSQQRLPPAGSLGQVFSGDSREATTPAVAAGPVERTTEPSLNSQRQDTLGGTEDTGESSPTEAASQLEDTGAALVSNTSGAVLLDRNTDLSTTTCRASNQSWPPTYGDDGTPDPPPQPPQALSPALFVPLYSDWNSAQATWGYAWEAHIYGLGSIFTGFGLVSVVCLLGLPLRCPPGIPYLTLLHLFLLAVTGIQAFSLLYDAYSHQDRLPPLGTQLLSELPFPCLISAFSLAILFLSLQSQAHLSLPLANSTPFSVLPKPCVLFILSLLHFAVSLGCVGLLQLLHTLPVIILLFPQGVFVVFTVFLSCSYLLFFCLIQVNTKHIYRLSDNGESGGSPEVMKSARCPFVKAEDWGRAAGAGVLASFFLLGCGGCQLYGILHALGFGGVVGYGFKPWPWWGYQIGCRLCEVGVCLCLSLIGAHPLFCHSGSSIKTITHPQPGSWSRLSCSSPPRGLTLPSQRGASSPVLSSHDSWSQRTQDKLVICDMTTKGQSEALPLFSMVDASGNGIDCFPKSSQTQNKALPLPTPSSLPHKPKATVESLRSSLDSLRQETDSTMDLRPPSPINLSRSIDQALFNESLFNHSIFGLPRLLQATSTLSLSSHGQSIPHQGSKSVENALFRTSSCGDVDQDNTLPGSRPYQADQPLPSQDKPPTSPVQWDSKGSVSGSTQGLCKPKETAKLRSNSWANRGQHFAQSSLPRAIPHLSYHRRYRTLSLASQDSRGSGRLSSTKQLSESKQLEWDLAVQAEFVNVCKQIDALSVCSDTIEL